MVNAFRYGSGLDLSGYEDGAGNLKEAAALIAAVAGASFVAVQQWDHGFDRFEAMTVAEKTLPSGGERAIIRKSIMRPRRRM